MSKLLIAVLLFASCAPKIVPPIGVYESKSVEQTYTGQFEIIWEKVIAMFSKKGISVKVIDKSSGFISVHYPTAPFTTEDKGGKLVDSNAWVVTAKIYDPIGRKYYSGNEGPIDWNIYIRKTTDKVTTVNIKLVDDPTILNFYSPGYIENAKRTYKVKAYSTGVFERLLAEQIR